MKIKSGDKVYNSFEELGDAILARLPEERQPVKWWKLHKPSISRGYCDESFAIHISRTWVGYLFIHIQLTKRWDIMFKFGDYKFKGEHAKG